MKLSVWVSVAVNVAEIDSETVVVIVPEAVRVWLFSREKLIVADLVCSDVSDKVSLQVVVRLIECESVAEISLEIVPLFERDGE